MKRSRQVLGLAWYLGSIQYGVCLFGGGASWFLAAHLTGFFGDDFLNQVAACTLMVALVGLEAWWAYSSSSGSRVSDLVADLLSSAAIAASGMVVVFGILAWLPG